MALMSPIQETAAGNLYEAVAAADFNGNNLAVVIGNDNVTPSQLVPDKLAKQTAELARDLIGFKTKKMRSRAGNKYTETMRRVVDEMLVRHEIVFSSMMRQLSITHDNAHDVGRTFHKVSDEMFADNTCNWGRVATVFAFAAIMAQYVVDTGISNGVRYEQIIAEALTDYVNSTLGLWIHKAGGWDAFCEFFPKERSRENTVRTGLLTVGLALGALATILVIR